MKTTLLTRNGPEAQAVPSAAPCRQGDHRQTALLQQAAMMADSPQAVRQRAHNDQAAQRALGKRSIVADSEVAEPGQLQQSAFLAALRSAVSATAGEVLGTTWSASSCPDIQKLFDHYAARAPHECETIMRRYSGIAAAGDARDYIAPICARIGGTIRRWGEGEVLEWGVGASGVPCALEATGAGATELIQAKPIGAATPGVTLDQLGPATSMDHVTGARMAQAFDGAQFSHVQIHTGAPAAQLVRALNADALAVGSHVAFAHGEYRPGTPAGDGLIAHELAHVVQQRGSALATGQHVNVGTDSALELDAEHSAGLAMHRLHAQAADNGAHPALSSGLSVRLGNKPDKEDLPDKAPSHWDHPEKEYVASQDELDEAISDLYISSILSLALALSRKIHPTLKNWSDAQIMDDVYFADGLEAALKHEDTQYALESPVWNSLFKHIDDVKEAIRRYHYLLHPMSAPSAYKQGQVLLPGSRILPDINKVSEETYADLEERGNYGDPEGKLALEKAELLNRDTAAEELDLLHIEVGQLLLNPPAVLGTVALCYPQALVYYKGTREAGHAIWTGVQAELHAVMTWALQAGYPINDASVQKRLAAIALALAQMRSKGNGSAGHSTMRR